MRPTLVTSRREFAGYWEYLLEDAIFTAPPHPRYAGAALIGPDGKLLGIGSLLVNDALPGRESLAGNMFVPIDHLKPILTDLIRTGRARATPRPWLGLFTEEFRDKLIIMFVAPDGPAEQAGVQVNDLILKVAGQPVTDQADFYRKLWAVGGGRGRYHPHPPPRDRNQRPDNPLRGQGSVLSHDSCPEKAGHHRGAPGNLAPRFHRPAHQR